MTAPRSPSALQSALYTGSLRHRRMAPRPHEFSYPLFMLYLDLDELPRVFAGRWLWSVGRPNLAWFRRADYLGPATLPLDLAVRNLVEERTGRRPEGPIRLLTHLRTWGLVMNPVSFYYCFDRSGERLENLVAEVTNTPWNERHAYVLTAPRPLEEGESQAFELEKVFHVSPFMPMEVDYRWRFTAPGRRLLVHMENLSPRDPAGGATKLFDATVVMSRQPLSGGNLARALARHPWVSAQVLGRIYWQALRLLLKGAPFHPHPKLRTQDRSTDVSLPGARPTGG